MVVLKELSPLPDGWSSLAAAFVQQVRRTPKKTFATDTSKQKITFADGLLRACAIVHYLQRTSTNGRAIGILVPPSVPATIANFAVTLLGKWAVNLNYTATSAVIDSAISQCEIDLVITSRKLVEKSGLEFNCRVVYLEDLASELTRADKAWAFCVARLVPLPLLGAFLPGLKTRSEDVTTVMFTSGSTGEPKGVMLTNGNILANIHQINTHARLQENDSILGILPFFHSFGFTVTLWAMAALGRSAAYHISPLDPRAVGKLLTEAKPTLMACTPTLMRSYLSRCTKEQFQSLRWLLLGSEKLKPELAQDITDILGLTPVEGFGCTEFAPVVTANSPQDVLTADGRTVHGNKLGSVGQPVAGTALAIVDINTHEVLPFGCGREGLIFAAGPQVMKGYLNRQPETDEVLDGDIYCTGDIGYIDEDGFLFIVDRLDQFAKLGGEMVPLIKVSGAMRQTAGVQEMELSVTSIPDAAKGERLIVLYTSLPLAPSELLRQLIDEGNLPKLWLPKAGDFYQIEAFPVGPTGKLDLKALRAQARELAA